MFACLMFHLSLCYVYLLVFLFLYSSLLVGLSVYL